VVTGRLAEDTIRRAISKYDSVEIYILPTSVAAFITPKFAIRHLKGNLQGAYDAILMPGTMRGDVSIIEEEIGVPTFKGPSDARDLPLVLSHFDEIKLSKTESATQLIGFLREEKALEEFRELEKDKEKILAEKGGFIIGDDGCGIAVGSAFPMRVIAEIVNAPTLELDYVKERARYYEEEGADIIDIGMLAGDPHPDRVRNLIEAVRTTTHLPVSIDTLDPKEIRASVDAGVDLILSVDRGNLKDVAPYVSDVPVVVLPTNMKEGILPKSAEERFISLVETISLAKDMGLGKIIADPVLEPPINPGLLESLKAYQLFRIFNECTPMLFGLGNVPELIDVDSPGVIGILAALATEVRADLLFVPEYSNKAKGSVRETVTASRMMYLANKRSTPPKDLGIDLLKLKEKRWVEKPYDDSVEETIEVVNAREVAKLILDDKGWFIIRIDRVAGLVVATHFRDNEDPDLIVKGNTAREIYRSILDRGLVGRMDHAAYLGKELTKAEMALKLGRSYIQDRALFN
jgi:dihydropteroate synthase-like protein